MNTENNNTPAKNQQTSTPTPSNTSPPTYDPIKGVIQAEEGQQKAPLASDQYGLERDPNMETDATVGTLDNNVRPASEVEKGEQQSIFERPVAPGVPNPTLAHDPNTRLPRFP